MIKRLGLILVFSCVSLVFAVEQKQKSFVNSIGMEMVRIEPGTFKMGQLDVPLPEEVIPFTNNKGDRMDFLEDGDFDEKPVHTVTISKGSFEALYEFDNIRFNPPKDRTMSNINLGFRFWRSRKLTLFFCHDHIQVELKDNENPAGFNYDTTNDIRYPMRLNH